VHSIVTPEQTKLLIEAIEHYREIQRLLARWEHESVQEILNPKGSNRG